MDKHVYPPRPLSGVQAPVQTKNFQRKLQQISQSNHQAHPENQGRKRKAATPFYHSTLLNVGSSGKKQALLISFLGIVPLGQRGSVRNDTSDEVSFGGVTCFLMNYKIKISISL